MPWPISSYLSREKNKIALCILTHLIGGQVAISSCANRGTTERGTRRTPDYTYFEAQLSKLDRATDYSVVKGVVTNGTRRLPRGTVVIRPVSNEEQETAVQSNERGEFEFIVREPGDYSVEFFYAYHLPAICQRFTLRNGTLAVIQAKLRPAPKDAEIWQSPLPRPPSGRTGPKASAATHR